MRKIKVPVFHVSMTIHFHYFDEFSIRSPYKAIGMWVIGVEITCDICDRLSTFFVRSAVKCTLLSDCIK